jgi:hypothetical protein
MSGEDPTPPIVLREPPRTGLSGGGDLALRPDLSPPPALHRGWSALLAPGETALWQGRPSGDPRRAAGTPKALFVLGFVAIAIALNAGLGAGVFPLLLIGYVAYRTLRKRRAAGGDAALSDRLYLVTDRAAYVARRQGEALVAVQSLPITPALQLGLGPREVTFASGAGPAPEGFTEISDAQVVHHLIRDIQKGQT